MDNNKVIISSLIATLIIILTVVGYIFINNQVKENIKQQSQEIKTNRPLKSKFQFKSQALPSIQPKNINLESEPQKQAQTVISINSNKLNYRVGETFNLKILINAQGEIVDGVEFALTYNPQLVKISQPAPGTFFALYPQKKVDENKGTVKVIALQKPDENKKCFQETVVNLTVEALEAGQINFAFDKEKTHAAGYGGQELLGKADNLIININK